MGKSVELLNGIGSKDGGNIPITNGMEYANPTRNFLNIDAESDNFIPNKYWVKGYINNNASRVSIPVTNPSSGFSYDSGITGDVPPNMGVYLVVGTKYQLFAQPYWDGATGLITTDVDAGADSYVLVVG